MIKAIFWDNDGVLVDTERLYFQANQEIFAEAGLALSERDYLQLFLRQDKGAWHLLEAQGVQPGEIQRLRDRRNERYSHLLSQEARVIAGVTDVLQSLHGKYLMGIVTSSRRDHFDVIHGRTDLLKYFDFVLTSGDFKRSKPNPDPYLMAIERSGAQPDECVAIEDSERGLEAATLAGIRCIVIPTPLTRDCEFAKASHIVHHAGDIPMLLEDL